MNSDGEYGLLERFLFPRARVDEARLADALRGKNVLITGASYGIGAASARLLADAGARVILAARTAEKLSALKTEIEATGGRADVYAVDLTDTKEIENFLRGLENSGNEIDIFISNAGKSIRRPLLESLERFHDFTRTMNLNYFVPVRLALALIPILSERKGHFINISAVNVLLAPAPFWAAYQASKTAFDQWFRSAAPELEAAGIAATSVYLPLVKTRMIEPTAAYDNAPAMSPEHVAEIIARAIYTKQKRYAPWWLRFGALGSVALRRPLEYAMSRSLKRNKELPARDAKRKL